MGAIYDRDGYALASASLRVSDDGTVLLAEGLARGSGLMHYFFQEGGRTVLVEIGGDQFRGHLATRWSDGRRTWLVRLEVAVGDQRSAIGDQSAAVVG